MLGTLRFRLTALFLAVVLVFGLASIALAVRLFQDVTRKQSVEELRREATGLAALYAESALRSSDEGAKAPEFAAKKLELATGDVAKQVQTEQAACDAACLGQKKALSEKVLTSAVILDANMMGATARVTSVGLPGGPKVYLMRMERAESIWKATMRKADDGQPLPPLPTPRPARNSRSPSSPARPARWKPTRSRPSSASRWAWSTPRAAR